MGKLPESPLEVRLAATLFLMLLGVANIFGAWQVKNFSAFTPRKVAATLGGETPSDTGGHASPGTPSQKTTVSEHPVSMEEMDMPLHRIDRELLVQDSHIHIPAYALTAAALALIVFSLRLPSSVRVTLVLAAFGAPFLDFAGLWGAHLFPQMGTVWAFGAIAGGFAMGLVYLTVAGLTILQCWFRTKE